MDGDNTVSKGVRQVICQSPCSDAEFDGPIVDFLVELLEKVLEEVELDFLAADGAVSPSGIHRLAAVGARSDRHAWQTQAGLKNFPVA